MSVKPEYTALLLKFEDYPNLDDHGLFVGYKVSRGASGEWISELGIPAKAKREQVSDDVWKFHTERAVYIATFVDAIPEGYRKLEGAMSKFKIYSALTDVTRSNPRNTELGWIHGIDETGTRIDFMLDCETAEYFDGMFRSGPRRGDCGIILK